MAVHDPGDHVPAGQILEVAGRRCRRPHVVVAADRRHPTAPDQHRLGQRLAIVHGQDPPAGKRDLAHRMDPSHTPAMVIPPMRAGQFVRKITA